MEKITKEQEKAIKRLNLALKTHITIIYLLQVWIVICSMQLNKVLIIALIILIIAMWQDVIKETMTGAVIYIVKIIKIVVVGSIGGNGSQVNTVRL